MLWYPNEPTALLWVAPVHVLGEAVFCSFRQDAADGKSNTACKLALRTGIPYTESQSVGFDRYYASGSQHMSTSRKSFFLFLRLSVQFDSVTPT